MIWISVLELPTKITKSDLMSPSDDIGDLSEFIDFVPDWDNVIDYFWSVEKRRRVNELELDDTEMRDFEERASKWFATNRILMWSRDFKEACDAQIQSLEHNYVVLHLKFSDGAILKFNTDSISEYYEKSELETIRSMLWTYSMEQHCGYEDVIRRLKENAPLIYDVTVTEDMGCEFSAISADGIVCQQIGMLLSTETGGNMPEFWDPKVTDDLEYNGKVEDFLSENLEIVPYENMALGDLENIYDRLWSLPILVKT